MLDTNHVIIGIDAFRLVGEPTSIGTYTDELIEALSRRGHGLLLYCPRRETAAAISRYENSGGAVRVIFARRAMYPDKSAWELFLWNQFELPRLMALTTCNLLISPYHQVPCLRPHRIPCLSIVHDLCGLRPDCGYRMFGRAWLRHYWNLATAVMAADRIIPISELTRMDLKKFFPWASKRISSPVHNQVSSKTLSSDEATEILKPFGLIPSQFILGFGTFGLRKGLDIAIEGYAIYRKSGGSLPIVLIGLNDHDELARRLKPEFLPGVVTLPRVSSCERDALYRLASCFLFCSRCEGFGYPVVEAMRQGCPVIASEDTTAQELIAGKLKLMRHEHAEDCASLIHAYDDISMADRQSLSDRLIEHSGIFMDGSFCERLGREIDIVLEIPGAPAGA